MAAAAPSFGAMVGAGAASGAASGIAGGLVQGGFNIAAASKAWDRSKNWATRHHLYEKIALEAAGYNPLLGAIGNMGSQFKAPQASPINPQFNFAQAISAAADVGLKRASAGAQTSAAGVADAEAALKRAELPRAEAAAKFWKSPLGEKAMRDIIMRERMPDGFMATLWKQAVDLAETNKDSAANIFNEIMQQAREILDEQRTKAKPQGPKQGNVILDDSAYDPYMYPMGRKPSERSQQVEDFINYGW